MNDKAVQNDERMDSRTYRRTGVLVSFLRPRSKPPRSALSLLGAVLPYMAGAISYPTGVRPGKRNGGLRVKSPERRDSGEYGRTWERAIQGHRR